MKAVMLMVLAALLIGGCCKITPEEIGAINEQARTGVELAKRCQAGSAGAAAACAQTQATFQAIEDQTSAK